MKMSSIAGVVCYVKDLDETAAFYEKLGFRLKREAAQLTAYVNWFWITFRVRDEELPDPGAGAYLYIKVEEDGETVDRYKWVRPSFLTAILDSGTHWQERPIVPNGLADPEVLYAGVR